MAISKNQLRKAKRKKASAGPAVDAAGAGETPAAPFVAGLVPVSSVVAEGLDVEFDYEDDEAFEESLMELSLSMILNSKDAEAMTDEEVEKRARELAETYRETQKANISLYEYPEEEADEAMLAVEEAAGGADADFMGVRNKMSKAALLAQGGERLSRKQRKELLRPQISQLKAVSVHPDVVESWDTTAKEPGLLIALKSWPNTVNVPTHWNSKRRYLAGKRAIDRGQFKLPSHIADTKIAEIRSALVAKEEDQTLRQKMRARARPKGHRMDVDYQTLHDAFFKFSLKPMLTGYGALYYEGKEQEMRFAKYQQGKMSEALKDALGCHTATTPVPWLFNMQRYGPPPAYPGHRIPGVNCPIPPGAEFGYGAGGWGAPPVDAAGHPLWGDLGTEEDRPSWDSGTWTSYIWGEMDQTGRRYDDDEEMDEASDDMATDAGPGSGEGPSGVVPGTDGMDTPNSIISGMTSTPSVGLSSGLDTPSTVDLRKGIESAQGGQLGVTPYKVLQQVEVQTGQQKDQFFQSSTLYDMQGALESATEAAEKVAPQTSVPAPTTDAPKEPARKKRKGFKF